MDHLDTPIREDAFQMDDQEKIDRIEEHMKGILQIIGMDLTDDSLKDTPRRVAKMYINEIFSFLFLPPVGGHVMKRNEANLPADAWTKRMAGGEKSRLFSLQFVSLDFLESCG
jgi:hypothetical protein